MILPETIPIALDQPQEVGEDDLQNLLDNQEDIEMLEGEVHRDSAAGIPVLSVVDHNYTGHPAKKMIEKQFMNNY